MWARAIGGAAAFLGWLVRLLVMSLPALAVLGSGFLISYGVWLFDRRAAFIVAGALGLLGLRQMGRRKA